MIFCELVQKMAKNPRGRPRSYDPDAALTQAMETFWEAGFTGTSLDDLATATGMNRPSLYAAFGDKKAIYLKSFELFADSLHTALAGMITSDMPLSRALEAFYGTAAEIYLSGPHGPRGCFISCTAPAEAARDADIRTALRKVLKEIDTGLEKVFARAKERGELEKDADTAGLAKLAGAVLHSLALRARAGATKAELQSLARQAAKTLR